MSAIKESTEINRKQMGYIKISTKSYPIYEGLNIIGRDIKATVRVSDLKFSKQHAVLSVVDETTHFISDFGSSNGTELKRNKLTPFKFYKIQDREVIIFGDVVGVYHTGVHSTQQEADSNATQSQVVDDISSTQLMTQNIHEKTTQPFDTIHNAATQEINKSVNTVSVHDLNTQVLPERPENPECATTEEKSQKESVNTENEFELSRTEIYDDVFANESFRLSLQNGASKYDIEVDETLPTDTKLNNSNKSNVSLDDDDIILSTQDNAMIEKQSLELIKKPVDSDSETDIEDEEELIKNLQQQSVKIDNETIKKKLEDSDSETDVEDDLVSKNNIENTKSNKVVFSDEEEELDLLAPTQKLQDAEFLLPTQILQTKSDKNEEEDDDLLLVPTQLLQNKPENILNESQDDIDLLAPTQLLEIKSCENNKQVHDENADAPTQLLENKTTESNNKTVPDEDYLAPTQLLQNKSDKNEPEVDDDLLAPTQLLQNKPDENVIEIDDEDDLPPTQLLSTKFPKNNQKSVSFIFDAPTQKLGENKVGDNLVAPKQLQNNSGDVIEVAQIHQKSILSPSKKPSILSTKSPKNNDTIFDMPTQKLGENKVHFESTILSTKSPKNNDSIYDMPTQKLGENKVHFESTILSIKSPNNNDSIYDMPTQKLGENKVYFESTILSIKSPKNNDSIFDMTTQKLGENKEKSSTSNIYLPPTQNLQNSMFSPGKKPILLSIKYPKNNDSIFDMPTQKLGENKNDDIFDAETQVLDKNKDLNKSNCSSSSEINNLNVSQDSSLKLVLNETDDKVSSDPLPETETQLEVDFALETQKIYVEEKTSRPDNPIGCKFAEEQTQMSEEIVEPPTRRLQVQLTDIKAASTSKAEKSDENDFKQEKRTRRKRNIEDTVAKNATKLNVTRVKNSDDSKNNNTKQNKDDSLVKSSETDEEIKPHNTRGKRISYQKLNSGKSEVKKVSTPKKSSSKETIKNTKKITEKSPDFDDFINRVTRSKRTHSTATPQKIKDTVQIEDSDEEPMTKYQKKKVAKLQYTDDSEITNSNSSSNSAVTRKSRSRSMKIEDYSSDENTNSVCLNTPNTKRRKFEPLNVTINNSQTSNISGETSKHKVVFTMLNDTNLESSVKKLGGSIIDSVQSCTVLVTNKISRSLKFLTAITLGKPIVQSKWITESTKKKIFLDPWNYLLEDKESETKFNFSLEESLKKSTKKKLFADLVVLLATKKNHDVLKELIETSGGKCIQRAPAKNGKAIVVSYEEDKAKYSKYLKQKNLTVVSAEAIFSGILQQEIQWKQHLLS